MVEKFDILQQLDHAADNRRGSRQIDRWNKLKACHELQDQKENGYAQSNAKCGRGTM
jgi:hypothetical protein